MSRVCTVVCFFEDIAHEAFITRLIQRASQEQSRDVTIDTRNATGGAKLWSELKAFLRDLKQETSLPDILVVVIDGDCDPQQRYDQAERLIRGQVPYYVIGVPDPHIERWYLGDPNALPKVLQGARPNPPRPKCQKNWYKNALREAIRAAGVEPLLGGAEYGDSIASVLDPHIVSRKDSSFDEFWKGLNHALKQC